MSNVESTAFVPVLTVMVDYGGAPFLWLADRPDEVGVGINVGNADHRDESLPVSETLWRAFVDWAVEFNRTAFYDAHFNADDWNWPAFHARGLRLGRWLKEEVGAAYRVVYGKPGEDPNCRIDERTEILADGALRPLPGLIGPAWVRTGFCRHIVSGGQTGADRGALEFAIRHGYTHGGWAPHGREAEDGIIPAKYQLTEIAGGYRQRTRRNVQDSDATLIVNLGELDGGTRATQVFAQQLGKPCLVIQVDGGIAEDAVTNVIAWLRQHAVKTLNVAGPRESKRPGMAHLTSALLMAVDAASQPV